MWKLRHSIMPALAAAWTLHSAMSLLLLTIVLECLAAGPAMAWGKEGHEIICAVAWEQATEPTRNRLREILSINNRDEFAALCSWADDYRLHHKDTGAWHFVNVPQSARSVEMSRDCSAPHSCAIAQIENEENALRTNSSPDPSTTLKFLIHFVGDLHQPLHVSFEEDRGGNEIVGHFYRRNTNLHAMWDRGIIEHDRRNWTVIADSLAQSVTQRERTAWVASAPLAWANESLAITLAKSTEYLSHSESFQLGEEYESVNLPIVLDRLKRAGVRLGAILNSVLSK